MSTSASSMPQPQKEPPPFRAAVLGFCKVLYQIGSPEVRAATFVFENTICFMEFDKSKRLTLDEFVNGRKLANGERQKGSTGAGFKDRANANRALKNLEDQQLLKIETDAHDGARKKKFYRLTLPSIVVSQDYKDDATRPTIVVSQDYKPEEDTMVLPVVVSQDYSGKSPKTTRSSPPRLLDQGRYLRKVPKESTSLVATVALASIAPDGAPKEDELALRETQVLAVVAAPASLSDSQAPMIPPAARLHEKQAVSPELESLWNLVRANLRASNSEATYDNWLAPLTVAGCEGTILYLQAKTSYNAEHFQHRFAEPASGELSKIIHRAAEVRCLPPPQAIEAVRAEPESPIAESVPAEPEAPTQDLFTAISESLGFGSDTKHLNDEARTAIGKVKKAMQQIGVNGGSQAALVIAQAQRDLGKKFKSYLMLPALPEYARQAGVLL